MQIQLRKVVPVYLEPDKISRSEIWNTDTIITSGEHLHIVAASGRGKTSLIHFIYGLRKDYNGVICFDGKDTRHLSLDEFSLFRQRHISIIFQDLRLFGDHTVMQNLEVKHRLHPFHPKERMKEMAERLGIDNKLDKPVKTCSYGEQQRVAIIRSLLQPFDLLLLDEPFSHLDNINRLTAFTLIQEECKKRSASMVLADLETLDFFPGERILKL